MLFAYCCRNNFIWIIFGFAFEFELSEIVFVLWTMFIERQALYSESHSGLKSSRPRKMSESELCLTSEACFSIERLIQFSMSTSMTGMWILESFLRVTFDEVWAHFVQPFSNDFPNFGLNGNSTSAQNHLVHHQWIWMCAKFCVSSLPKKSRHTNCGSSH